MRKLGTWKQPSGFYSVVDLDADFCVADCLPTMQVAKEIMRLLNDAYEDCEENNPALIMLEKLTYKPTEGEQG
jgi:hypothetical protein